MGTVTATGTATTTTSTTIPSTPRWTTARSTAARSARPGTAEGRHDAGYYRTRDSVQPERPTKPEPKVSADRGARSSGAGLGRAALWARAARRS